MVPDISTGSRTRGLLSYLFGPGRRDEHTDPHIVAAFAMPGLPDPGRVPLEERHDALTELATYLDQPVRAREQRLGKKVPQHVWHCPVRTAPGDRYLTDEEWAEVARRIVHATGIAPDGDDAACRWIAVRHADDHIHIMATTVREDGRRPRTNRDGQRAQAECRTIEKELGLRRLKSGDFTAPKRPTSAERAKAQRAGNDRTALEWLRGHAYVASAAAQDEEDYFSLLASLGIKVKLREGPQTGDVIGYSLAAPGDTNAQGEPVFFGGSTLAPDLSINRLRERFAAQEPSSQSPAVSGGLGPWHHADTALRTVHAYLVDAADDRDEDPTVQAQAAAFSELLHNAVVAAPRQARAELRAAAAAFNRANRSAIRAQHQSAAALRTAGKHLLRTMDSNKEGDAIAAVLCSAIYVLMALERWHETRGHQQQAAAAQQSLGHLHSAYQRTAAPVLIELAQRTPSPQATQRFAADVRHAIPDHADRILADPAWPALATTLARAESAGQRPRHVLAGAAQRRELDTADRPAEVLNWRLRHQTNVQHDARIRAATARPHGHTSARPAPATPRPAAETAHRPRRR